MQSLKTLSQIGKQYFSTMKAFVLEGKNQVMTLQDIKIPKPKKNEVLVKINSTGVCHTDLHIMTGDIFFPLPCILGHEISGEVLEINDCKGDKLKVGQKVVGSFIMPCGECPQCDVGQDDMCEVFFKLNRLKGTLYDGTTRLQRASDNKDIYQYSFGGLGEYCVAPIHSLYPLPDNVPYDNSAIIGCAIFTAFGALKNNAQLKVGEDIAVIGIGGIGINIIQLAKKVFCANRIIAVDIDDDKLQNAIKYGATHTINSKKENAVEKIQKYTNGKGVDVGFEALGKKQTFEQVFQSVKDGGRAVMVGISTIGQTAEIEINRLVRRQIKVMGSFGAKARQDVPTILNLAANGVIDFPISNVYKFQDSVKAFEDLQNGKILGRGIIKF